MASHLGVISLSTSLEFLSCKSAQKIPMKGEFPSRVGVGGVWSGFKHLSVNTVSSCHRQTVQAGGGVGGGREGWGELTARSTANPPESQSRRENDHLPILLPNTHQT